jgi:hypothetical protein
VSGPSTLRLNSKSHDHHMKNLSNGILSNDNQNNSEKSSRSSEAIKILGRKNGPSLISHTRSAGVRVTPPERGPSLDQPRKYCFGFFTVLLWITGFGCLEVTLLSHLPFLEYDRHFLLKVTRGTRRSTASPSIYGKDNDCNRGLKYNIVVVSMDDGLSEPASLPDNVRATVRGRICHYQYRNAATSSASSRAVRNNGQLLCNW